MKKTTHTAGTKSYARWSEDMVSHLLFKKFIYDSSYFPYCYFFRGKLILKKNSHIEQWFTLQLTGKGEKG
jgi:hypothetical protein